MMNPELNVGDRIVCYHMEDELSVTPGTKGTVTRIQKDPFDNDGKLISVDWDNGSQLSLISSTDLWKLVEEKIQEQVDDPYYNLVSTGGEIFQFFDLKWLRNYLNKIRNSGIVNMYESPHLLYSGKNYIDRYYGEGREDDEDFQEVLENAEESKNKMIQGVLKYMDSKHEDIDIDKVNMYVRKFSKKIVTAFMLLGPRRDDN